MTKHIGACGLIAFICKTVFLVALVAMPGIVAAQGVQNDWPSYNRTLSSDRYAPFDEINRANVGKLHPICTYDFGLQTEFETGPLVVGNVLYATSEMDIVAIDADTCQEKWRTHEDIPIPFRHFPTNRGAAYFDGKLFRGTQDGRVFAYDAASGKKLWETKIQHARAESVPAAPIAWNGLVFIGNAGGDAKGVKGRMYALDAASGKVMWETYLVPADDEAAKPSDSEQITKPTWKNIPGVPITGGATWTSYTLDAQRGLLYVPGGNPAPDFNRHVRPGANLFAGSVVVLDAKTGAYKRHFSLVPQDFHDWDVSAAPVLVTTKAGKHLLADAGKNGLLYGIDLDTGKRLYAVAITKRENMTAPLTAQGTRFCPGAGGGTEWNGPGYSPDTNLIYDGTVDRCSTVSLVDDDDVVKVKDNAPFTGAIETAMFGKTDPTWSGWLYAIDADSGKVKWRYHAVAPVLSGITPTKGGLVFAGDMSGNAFAFDAATGKQLWTTKLDGAPGGGLITYMVGGHQRVAIVSGTNSPVFDLALKGSAKIVIFGL
jgi:alcohol dehydrogenase (cytochrome c)